MAKSKKNIKQDEEIVKDDSQNSQPNDEAVVPSDSDIIQDDDGPDYSIGTIVVDDENAEGDDTQIDLDAALEELDPSLSVDENWDFEGEGDDFLGAENFEDDGDYGEDY